MNVANVHALRRIALESVPIKEKMRQSLDKTTLSSVFNIVIMTPYEESATTAGASQGVVDSMMKILILLAMHPASKSGNAVHENFTIHVLWYHQRLVALTSGE